MTEEQEKKNRKIAMATSLGVHTVVLLLLLFIVAWRSPDPPLPEYGIELNFGMDMQGSGDMQPETPAASQTVEPDEPEEVPEDIPLPEPEEIAEEVVEETQPEQSQSAQPEVVSELESPVVVEEKKEKPIEKPQEKPLEKATEPKPEVKPQEVPKAVYKPKTTPATTGKTDEKAGTPANEGNDVNKAGDKGNPEGKVDAKAIYGKHGGGGGGISVIGFNGFGTPTIETPTLPDQPYGIYEFKVTVDDQGYVTSIKSVQRGLSFEAERRLKAVIQNLRFIPKGTNLPPQSEGTITFKVVSAAD